MKSYNFFRKASSFSYLNVVFLKSKLVFFSNITILNTSYLVKLKKLLLPHGLKFCFCNKTLIKKSLFFSRFLNYFDFLKGNLIVVYSFRLNYKELFKNTFFINELFKLFLCSYFYRRFMFLNQTKYFLKYNISFVKLFYALACFVSKITYLLYAVFKKK